MEDPRGPSLIQALKDDWGEVLAGIGPAAIPALTKALQEKNPEIRVQAAEALGLIGPAAKPAIPDLHRALKDSSEFVVAESALACWGVEAKTEIFFLTSHSGKMYTSPLGFQKCRIAFQ